MASTLEVLKRPAADADYRSRSAYRTVGFVVAIAGLMAVAVAAIGNLAAAAGLDTDGFGETLAWTFGLTTLGFGTIKLAIAVRGLRASSSRARACCSRASRSCWGPSWPTSAAAAARSSSPSA